MGLEALLVLVFFFLPGLIADAVYRFLRWVPDPSDGTLFVRAALFSGGGLLLLVLSDPLVDRVDLLPAYLLFDWTQAGVAEALEHLTPFLTTWSVHVAASLLLGLLGAWVLTWKVTEKLVSWTTGKSLYESAWQEFVRKYFGTWVKVRTVTGSQVYGRLGIVSGRGDRAIVLWQPANYEERDGMAVVTVDGTKGLYLPEAQIAEIAVAYSDSEVSQAAEEGLLGSYDLSTGRKLE